VEIFPDRISITLKNKELPSVSKRDSKTSAFPNKLLLLASTVILILLWKLISLFMGSEIILPSPESAFSALAELVRQEHFARAIFYTVRRGVLGFVLSASAALIVGIAAGENRIVYNLLKPVLTIVKTVPVLSIVLLAIIWFKTENVPVFVCFLVVFPVISANVIEGIKNVDPHLIEMAHIYRVRKKRIIFQIYLPSLIPYLLAGLSTAAGVTWKAVIAAEVLSMPRYAIGSGMQFSQLQLNTAELFAWTIIAVIISSFSEALLMALQYLLPWRRKV
jgi:NitT/TauT family transport system permease protein